MAHTPVTEVKAAKPQDAESVGLDGNSGHSNIRRLRFAFAGYGPFAAAFIVFFAKDMYVLKLGADTNRAGALAAVWSVAFPVAYVVSGNIMDRGLPIFDRPGWGRRAFWFGSHLIPLSVTCFLIFLPGLVWVPTSGSWILDMWLASCLIVSAWCLPVLFNAIESARAEIYPFKDERVVVEAMTKFTGVFAAASGIVPQMILWVNATLATRFAVSLFLMVVVLLSLEAVPVLKDARQPHRSDEKPTFTESLTVLKNPAMLHATCVRFWHSAADTTYLTFAMYYITFVDGKDSVDRARWMFLSGVFVALLEFLVLVPFWTFVWTRDASSKFCICDRFLRFLADSMRSTCCMLHVLGALLPPLCLRLLPIMGLKRPWEFVINSVCLRFFYSPQAFFRINCFCWVVDEDCHRGDGRRREAVHAGVVKFFEDEGRALAFALFVGLGWAGLQTENCELVCDGAGDREGCVRDCDRRDIARQPEAVSDYINAVMTYVIPCFGLMCALHIWLFPIHSGRLKDLQQTQASVFKKVQPDVCGVQSKPSTITAVYVTPNTRDE